MVWVSVIAILVMCEYDIREFTHVVDVSAGFVGVKPQLIVFDVSGIVGYGQEYSAYVAFTPELYEFPATFVISIICEVTYSPCEMWGITHETVAKDHTVIGVGYHAHCVHA